MAGNAHKFTQKEPGRSPSQSAGVTRAAPISFLPEPPEWLNVDGVREWERLGAILLKRELLIDDALTHLAHYCAMHSQAVALTRTGEVNVALMSAMRAYFADFMGTPASQVKLPAGQRADKPANKFEGLRAVK